MDGTVNIKPDTEIYTDKIQVVAFQLGNEEYAVDILKVQEINRLMNITRVPRAGEFIEGVINLRGNIIPVINLYKKFNLVSLGEDDDKRIIVFQFEELKAGIIVDKVSEVLQIDINNIEETAKVYTSIDAEIIRGVAKVDNRLLILLDIEKLLGIEAN
ncbi:MAG: chemotaxis protein CheW [Syntrophomonas sp.]|nr:chemotaxis protein CheW [Syntrophomonas sp.]